MKEKCALALYGLVKPTADDIFAAMKALVTFIAIAAVSVAGAGFYYVSSTSEPVQPVFFDVRPESHLR